MALKSDTAAEKSKINFREIFRVARFSTFATISSRNGPAGGDLTMSVDGGRAEVVGAQSNRRD